MAVEIPKNRALLSKDASNFRAALKLYEGKQYKKALKGVESVLKKNPQHGESLALKGLVTYHLGRKDEGHEFIKQGLKNDMTSYVCWHIYGLYHRQEKNYEEATKCYARALQLDPENQNVVRDLSILQMQVGQYEPLVVSRKKMLQDKPGFRQNWTALAIAQHMAGDYVEAEETLHKFEQVLKEPLPKTDVENSEVTLYCNRIIYESGDVKRALANLEDIADRVSDELSVSEYRAQYLLELGRSKEAEREYRALIKRNPNSIAYYEGLEKALGIPSEEEDAATRLKLRTVLYARLATKYPKADIPRAVPLRFLPGDSAEFKELLASYLSNLITREVPSASVMIKDLYKDPTKVEVIDAWIYKFHADVTGTQNGYTPSTTVWTLYFLAQHFSYQNKYSDALETIEKAIVHTPTLLELQMMKAKLLKSAGDVSKAAEVMEVARSMDLQDRFINTKAGKYFLRADRMDDAIKTISLFTKNDTTGNGVQDLHDMQGTSFLVEQAESYLRLGNKGLALKRFTAIVKIFEDFKNDQFDFHFYCPRRGTIRSYIQMVRWAKTLYGHHHYVRAATGAINMYLDLARSAGKEPEDEFEGLDEAERKKAQKKAKKELAKQLKKEHEELEKSDSTDQDPFGKQLLATKTPLEDAFKIWLPLSLQAADETGTWQLAFEIYLSQKKFVLALQSLTKAKAAGASAAYAAAGAIRLRVALGSWQDPAAETMRKLIGRSLPSVAVEGDINADNASEYLDKYALVNGTAQEQADAILDWARAKLEIGDAKAQVATELTKIAGLQVELPTVRAAFKLAKKLGSGDEFKAAAQRQWPLATVFEV